MNEEVHEDPLKAGAQQNDRLHRFSHDIRDRIGSLMQAANFMRDTPEGLSQAELDEFAEKQFFGALRCVEDLLDDMQVPRGVGELKMDAVDLVALHQEAAKNIHYRFEEKKQQLNVQLPEALMVQGNATFLTKCMQALLSNASKFSSPGSSIHVSLILEKGKAKYLVKDKGVGLAAADLEKVFQRFVILSSRSTAGEAQGRSTLARVAQWVNAHNGALTATSAGISKGASFTMEIPA